MKTTTAPIPHTMNPKIKSKIFTSKGKINNEYSIDQPGLTVAHKVAMVCVPSHTRPKLHEEAYPVQKRQKLDS